LCSPASWSLRINFSSISVGSCSMNRDLDLED
jgi:hypothetical protein